MKLVVFTLARRNSNPDVGAQQVAINRELVVAVMSAGNTDTCEIWTVEDEYQVMGTFDEVCRRLVEP
jgi:hypothetical protein